MKIRRISAQTLILFMTGTIFVPFFVLAQSDSQVEINVGATVESANPFVTTNSASGVGETEATLNGDLIGLGQETQVDVFFQYREQGAGTWQETPRQTTTTTGSFSEAVSGLSNNTTYEFRAAVEWDGGGEQNFGSILTFITGTTSPPPSSGPPPSGKVLFQGYAYPEAFITISKAGNVAATFVAETDGTFEREITSAPGVYSFSVYAIDSEGRQSVTNTFQAPVFSNLTTTVSGIFLSPTITAESENVPRGQDILIRGEGFPGSIVRLFVDPEGYTEETTVSADGRWEYSLDTDSFNEGEHYARVRAFLEGGEQSPFSEVFTFTVLPPEPELEPEPDPDPDPDSPVPPPAHPCSRGDLNRDGRVNLVDVSIWVFYHETDNACSDQNSDGIVDLVDLAIIVYYWTD